MSAILLRLSCALIACGSLWGCQSYVVTPNGADMAVFGMPADERTRVKQTDNEIADALELVPLARFPASFAVVRVQSAALASRSHGVSYGRGAYAAVLTPTVETEDHLRSIAGLPMVAGVVRLNRLVLGEQLRTDRELRTAAARLHADLLLIYTINTEWTIENNAEPLDAITLGLRRYKEITITATATAMLVGTHNGYIYATAEVAEDTTYHDNAWRNREQVDAAREQTEQKAFDNLVEVFIDAWPAVVSAYAKIPEARR